MVGVNSVDSFDPSNSWQGLTLTDKAANQINKLLEKDESLRGLRLTIKSSGCAGYAYVLSTVDEVVAGDLAFEHLGAKLFVPLDAMPYLDGTEVDFISQGLNQMFQYNNPKVQSACGCGESFNV
ncbi:Fe-S cluster assembly scaffold SufA [Vibrio sp. V1B]|uniref:Fe-S cluster assembly scaffold SufA n=1 Tax=Vibrio harveyi group TaxID=717610 RepID=UPI0003A387B3|nr:MULTISPECIES: Fe-S cluster assembly scaffold SufA [Vibrio harveyi group]PAW09576.1 Fe-S cluster assembly scaffold SufA [Vibrio sp. V1B]